MVRWSGESDPETGEERKASIGRRAWTATVFHVCQTDPGKV